MRKWQALVPALLVTTALAACASAPPPSPPPRRAPEGAGTVDAGFPAPKSNRHGVILPSDTKIGAPTAGSAPATGTSGGTGGPTLGDPNSGPN